MIYWVFADYRIVSQVEADSPGEAKDLAAMKIAVQTFEESVNPSIFAWELGKEIVMDRITSDEGRAEYHVAT